MIAAHLWRSWWARKHVLFRSDNEAVVAILTTRTSKVPALMHLLRDLLLSAARWGFTFTAAHVPGVENKIADAISPFRWQDFRQLAPEAYLSPCLISQLLLDSLTPLPRTMMLAFLGRGSGSFHLESICIRSVQVRRVLPPSWKASPQWLALPCR